MIVYFEILPVEFAIGVGLGLKWLEQALEYANTAKRETVQVVFG